MIAGVVFAFGFALLVPVDAQPVTAVTEFQPAVYWTGRAVAVTVNPANTDHAIVASESGGLFKTRDHGVTWSHIDYLPMFRMRDVKYGPVLPHVGQPVIATGWGDSRVGNRGGIWRSHDGGLNWDKPDGSNPGCAAFAGAWGISFLPDTGDVYVGTDCGLAISQDYGATWMHTSPNPSGDPSIYGVVAHYGAVGFLNSIVDICGAAGHQRSTDRGATFGSVTRGSPAGEGPHCIAVSLVESGVVFVAGRVATPSGCKFSGSALFEGDYDSGGTITWRQVIPSQCRTGRPSWVATNRSRDNDPDHFDIYFGTGQNVWRQTVTTKGGPGPRCSNTAWTPVKVDHPDQSGMAFSTANNCAQFMVSDGGVHRPTDEGDLANCGADWRIAGTGYNALQIYHVTGQMSLIPLLHTDLYFGTQDNSLWASDDGGTTWPYPDPSARRWYNEGWYIQVPRYAISAGDERVTWVQPVNQPNRAGPAHFEGPFSNGDWYNPPGQVIDNPTLIEKNALGANVYVQYHLATPTAGFPTLKITTDFGTTWNSVTLNPILRLGWPQVSVAGSDVTLYQPNKRGVPLCSLAPSSGEEKIGLHKITGIRTDGSLSGATAKLRLADVTGLGSLGAFCLGEGTFVCPIVFGVDPNDPSHLIAADVETSQMKVTIDGGASWAVDTQLTDLVTGLDPATGSREFRFYIPQNEYPPTARAPCGLIAPGGNVQAHVIAFDPFHRGHILVGTEAAGIFRSTDGGITWATIPNSRKVTGISSIFFIDEFRNGNSLPEAVVSTYGRGLWKLTFPPGDFSPPFGGPPDWHDCWLRSPMGGCIMPADLFDFDRFPYNLYNAVVDGSITDILLSPEGIVQSLAIDGGRVIGSTQNGQRVAPTVPIFASQTPGNFAGCPECASLVQQGGAVKGIVLEDGRLNAIIGGFGPLPGEDLLRLFSPPPPQPVVTPEVTAPVGPYLRLVGTIAVGGQPTALIGDTVAAAGSGFCGDAGCSPVVLSIGDRVVATNVPVDTNGNFQATFTLTEPPGAYTVTAVQQAPGAQILSDAARLVVPVGGRRKELGERPGISIGINFAADEPPGVGSALSPSDRAGVVPQANWNNLTGPAGAAANLVIDSSGSPIPSLVSATWSSPNTWSTTGRGGENNGFPPGPDRTLMTGYLDTTDVASGAATVTVSGLGPEFTTRGYDVIVYALGGIGGRGGGYTIGSTTKIGTAPTNPTDFIEDPGIDMTDEGNYLRFAKLYAESFTLTADASLGNFRAPINGIQIVASPGYDFNDGMLPSGASFPGVGNDGRIADDGTGSNGVVHLTDANQGGAFGVFSIPAPAGGSNVDNIHIHWRSLVGGDNGSVCTATQFGRPGADGYSMSWGTDLPNPPSYGNPGEEGAGSGLIVNVDTFDNGGGEAPGLEIKWRGARVAFDNINPDPGLAKDFLRKGVFVDADLTVDTTGHATFTYDGRVLTAPLTDWGGIPGGGCIMFAARTGGACDNHWIDDLVIEQFRPDRPVLTARVIGGQFQILLPTVVGRTYTIESTDDLSPQGVWSPVPGNSTLQGTGGIVVVNCGQCGGPGAGFFRVRVILNP